MPTATYRIGPSDFFTPGDLHADADEAQAQIALLDSQLVGNELADVEFSDQWTSFETSWRTFYNDHFAGYVSSLFSALNDSNRDDLIRYETQLAAFQARAQSFGATSIAPVGPSSGSGDTLGKQLGAQGLPGVGSLVIVALAVSGVLLVWKS